MAGDWLKIEACTPDKPEVIGIADMLGIPPAHAFGSLFMIWRWFDQHTTTGNASYVTKVTIDRLAGNDGFADAMLKVCWLVVDGEGYVSLPHFDRHNGETAKQRGLTAKRVAKSKSKSNATGNALAVTKPLPLALPREEKRREEIKPKNKGIPPSAPFVPPDWIDLTQWTLWMKTRKGKKMTPDQMQANVNKLEKWRNAGLDHCGALADAAAGGWQGLHEPKPPPRTNASGVAPWWSSNESMLAKGKEFGMQPRAGESWNDFKSRLSTRISEAVPA